MIDARPFILPASTSARRAPDDEEYGSSFLKTFRKTFVSIR